MFDTIRYDTVEVEKRFKKYRLVYWIEKSANEKIELKFAATTSFLEITACLSAQKNLLSLFVFQDVLVKCICKDS